MTVCVRACTFRENSRSGSSVSESDLFDFLQGKRLRKLLDELEGEQRGRAGPAGSAGGGKQHGRGGPAGSAGGGPAASAGGGEQRGRKRPASSGRGGEQRPVTLVVDVGALTRWQVL